jgi:phytanoyl-CoA hydroxylase
MQMANALPSTQLTQNAFARDGYMVLRGVLDEAECREVGGFVAACLDPLMGPAEYEADVGYPGSPSSRGAPGGTTPRRLLHAYSRSQRLRRLALHPDVAAALERVMDGEAVCMSQCHHNCVMTKHPGYSSATLWHQDIRYWSFDRPELVSAWFALSDEDRKNGALRLIPGSHRLELDRGRFDRDLFLRPELDVNRDLIHRAVAAELRRGDVLLFHCRLLHAAGKNLSDTVKLSPVFTYHTDDNRPIPGTKSAQYPSIALRQR